MLRNISIAISLVVLIGLAVSVWPSPTQPNVRKNVEAEKFNPGWSTKK